MAKQYPKKNPVPPAGPSREEGRDRQAVEFKPNPIELLWEKYHKVVYGLLIVLIGIWGIRYLRDYWVRRAENLEWKKVYQDSGLMAQCPPMADPFSRLEETDPVQIDRLAKERAGDPLEPWLLFFSARNRMLRGEVAEGTQVLQRLQRDFPHAEVNRFPIAFAFHKQALSPVAALLEEIQEDVRIQETIPHLFRNPVPDTRLTATVDTDEGTFKIRFFTDQAPKHVANFVAIVQEGFFSDQKIHKVSKGGNAYSATFLEFGNPMTRDPKSKPEEWTVSPNEKSVPYEKNRLYHFAGAVTAVRTIGDKKTDKGLVRVMGEDYHRFDGESNVFGQVVEGLEVVRKIAMNAEIRGGSPYVKEGVPVLPPTIRKIALEGDLALVLPASGPASQPTSQPASRPASGPGRE